MSIYILKCLTNAEEYIKVEGDIGKIKIPILNSEIHKLTEDKLELGISEEGGLEIPDVLYYEGILFVSNQIKELMNINNANYIFWKEVDIKSEKYGIHEKFWIMVPPRIDCIDIDRSIIDFSSWHFADGIIPVFEFSSISIVKKMLGRFEVFKILGILDNNIYVTEKIYTQINFGEFEGIDFIKLQ